MYFFFNKQGTSISLHRTKREAEEAHRAYRRELAAENQRKGILGGVAQIPGGPWPLRGGDLILIRDGKLIHQPG